LDERVDRPKFIVGLGNPGRRYSGTRHNVGYEVVNVLRQRWNAGEGRNAFGGRYFDARVERSGRCERVGLLCPETFMNRSGRAVSEMVGFYKADHEEVLIVLDDMALPAGTIRARATGSAGGHKGLADVINALGSELVPRLRVGIGTAHGEGEAVDYVLSRFQPEERQAMELAIGGAADAAEDWVFRGVEYVMNRYNRKEDAP